MALGGAGAEDGLGFSSSCFVTAVSSNSGWVGGGLDFEEERKLDRSLLALSERLASESDLGRLGVEDVPKPRHKVEDIKI